jgi:hypothetical protein
MQQIADWLKKLGISEYAERFAENDIVERKAAVPAGNPTRLVTAESVCHSVAGQCAVRVKARKAESEQRSSALPPIAIDARTFLIGSSVP